jgi:hypothetical protein
MKVNSDGVDGVRVWLKHSEIQKLVCLRGAPYGILRVVDKQELYIN